MSDQEPTLYTDDTNGVIERAIEAGQTVVYPGECEIQIDIDNSISADRFNTLWAMFVDIVGGAIVKSRTTSKSGYPKEHITVTLSYPLNETERLLLQAIMGSDPRRELFGYRRVKQGFTPVTIFIEPAPISLITEPPL